MRLPYTENAKTALITAEKVAGAYASTYPIALVAVVIVSQVLIIIFR